MHTGHHRADDVAVAAAPPAAAAAEEEEDKEGESATKQLLLHKLFLEQLHSTLFGLGKPASVDERGSFCRLGMTNRVTEFQDGEDNLFEICVELALEPQQQHTSTLCPISTEKANHHSHLAANHAQMLPVHSQPFWLREINCCDAGV